MGIFGIKKGNINQTKEKSINDLNLRKEKFELCLTKKNINNIVARVALVIDKSGSMNSLYRNGTVQKVIEQILPIGLKFDDNGQIDIWTFDNFCNRLKSIGESDFFDYVNREILSKGNVCGGTNFVPVMENVICKYVEEEPSKTPTFVIFITDGENYDKVEAEELIKKSAKYNIFWQFVGIGNENFRFLKKLDDIKGRIIDNADFFQIDEISNIKDEELYNSLMNEYPGWETEAKRIGLI